MTTNKSHSMQLIAATWLFLYVVAKILSRVYKPVFFVSYEQY